MEFHSINSGSGREGAEADLRRKIENTYEEFNFTANMAFSILTH